MITRYAKLFNEIKNTKGKGSAEKKLSLLMERKDDNVLKEIVRVCFNDEVKTGIGVKKLTKEVKIAPNIIISNILEFLHYLEVYCSGKDQDIANIQLFINNQENEEVKDFLRQVATKELKIGFTKELNKVWEGIVIVPKAQKGHNVNDYIEKVNGKKVYISTKLDGHRATYENNCKFNSYNVKEYKDLEELRKEIDKLPKEYVYDGELQYIDSTGKLTRKEIKGKTAEILATIGEKKNIEFVIFDIIDKEHWDNDKIWKKTFEERRALLESLEIKSPLIRLVDILSIQIGLDNVEHWLQYAKERGLEGVIINLADNYYEYKRSFNIFKLKDIDTIDLRIIDIQEGKDEFTGMLGAFIVSYKENRVHVGGGRGLNHELRALYFKDKQNYIGKIIEVSHFGESVDKTTKLKSLTSPLFCGFRDDKDKADA